MTLPHLEYTQSTKEFHGSLIVKKHRVQKTVVCGLKKVVIEGFSKKKTSILLWCHTNVFLYWLRGNIFPHVRFQLLVCTSFPTCTVPVCIFELSLPLFPHVQFHPNMHYPFLAHVRSKLHLINNNFIKINDQKIFSRLIMVRLG